MLQFGTDKLKYEKYTGGIASPNIDYPSEVESVGDNVNLFNKNILTNQTVNSKTGTISNNLNWRLSEYIEVVPFTDYTFSWESSSEYFQARINMYDENKVYLQTIVYELNNIFAKTFKTIENCKYVRVNYSVHVSDVDVVRENIKLEKGINVTTYSPYGQGSIEIKQVNDNFWGINNASFTPTVSSWHDFNGISNMYNNNQYNKSTAKIKLKAGNYYMSYGETVNISTVQAIKIDGSTNGVALVTGKGSFTLTEDSEIMIRLNVTTANVKTSISNAQIVSGTEEKEYSSHQSQTKVLYTQQPLRSIGDVKDKFIKENGVWYEKHYFSRYTFTGEETVSVMASSTDGYPRYGIAIPLTPTAFDYDKVSIMSNMFKGVSHNQNAKTVTGQLDLVSMTNTASQRVAFRLSDITINTGDLFKAKLTELYNAGTPVYVDYVLATPTLIECTAEQVEQLEYFEKDACSYDGVTTIYSTDEVSPYFEVTAYKGISDEFKERIRQGKITRGYLKVLATDTQEEFIINENNYLKDLKIQELRYIPDEGFIGGTVAKKLSGNFNNVDNSFSIQDREVEAYLGVDLSDGTTEYIKYGTYIVQAPEDNQVNDNTSFEALDYMIKFNLEYVDRMTYPCTIKQLLDDIADQAGVSSKIGTFLNGDFIVENNQFETGTTLRDVLKAITQMAFNWARVDEEDNLVFDFKIKDDTDEIILSDEYFNFTKSNEYGPVNTIILRNSQVEGENVTIKDEESVSSVGEIELVIADNPFAYTQEKRTQLIEAGRKLFGLRYTPMSMDMIGLMYLNAKDRIGATNPNGEIFYTYLLDHTIDYNGVVLDSMESQAKTKTETKYQFTPQMVQALRHTEIKVDKANQQIQSIITEQEEIQERVAKTVSKIEVFYALGDNSTIAPTTDWSTIAPEWQEDKYMWQKTTTTYADGTIVESEPTNISGASGKDGSTGKDGVGVKEIATQYYLSDSNETQTGGEWKEIQDSWEEGKYIWTRTKVTWTDNSITYTTPILATTLNDLNSTVVDIGTDLAQSKKDLQVRVKYIEDNGVDKVLTTMGYTFDNEGLKINKTNATTGTLIDETAVQVIDKSGSKETDILYAGYVKEGNTKYADYVGQTIVSAANLIVRNYLVIGDNSRFESYSNPTLGGTGTGAFDI